MLAIAEYGDRCRRCAELARAGDIVDKAAETGPRCLECMAKYAGRYYTEDELKQIKPKLGRRERIIMLRMWKPGEVVHLNGKRIENVIGHNQEEGVVRYRVLDENGRLMTIETKRGNVTVSAEDTQSKQPESKIMHDMPGATEEQTERVDGSAASTEKKRATKAAK